MRYLAIYTKKQQLNSGSGQRVSLMKLLIAIKKIYLMVNCACICRLICLRDQVSVKNTQAGSCT
jgi:hypothetical protein